MENKDVAVGYFFYANLMGLLVFPLFGYWVVVLMCGKTLDEVILFSVKC